MNRRNYEDPVEKAISEAIDYLLRKGKGSLRWLLAGTSREGEN